jgi:hypothetical protein
MSCYTFYSTRWHDSKEGDCIKWFEVEYASKLYAQELRDKGYEVYTSEEFFPRTKKEVIKWLNNNLNKDKSWKEFDEENSQ